MRKNVTFGFLLVGFGSVIAASCIEGVSGCDYTGTCKDESAGGASGGSEPDDGNEAGAASTGGSAAVSACTTECEEEAPICDEATGNCVECAREEHCVDAFCDQETGTCVECLKSSDCTDLAAARCEEGECVRCVESSDCAGTGQPVCDDVAGVCVECVAGRHETCGPGRLCHGELGECVTAAAGTVATCHPCVADAHCQEGRHCVAPDRFGEEGYFCLPEPDPGCAARRPFVYELEGKTSIDGKEVNVCGHRFTSCAGVLHFASAVDGCGESANVPPSGEGDAACGLLGQADNTRCRDFGGQARCSYRCTSKDDCLCGHDCLEQVCSLNPNGETCEP